MRSTRLIALSLVALLGCGASESRWMPLGNDKSWTYMVRPGLQTYTIQLKTTRPIAVGGAAGYELSSELGAIRLGWKGDELLTDQMANARFLPALPLIAKTGRLWRGWVTVAGKRSPAKGDCRQENKTLTLGGRTVTTLCTTWDLKVGPEQVQLMTWFQEGYGIVQQEQRRDGKLDLSIQRLVGG